MQIKVRSRQETVNKRFKNLGLLKQVFCHDILRHGINYSTIAVMTQIIITNGENFFEYGYHDPPYEEDETGCNDDEERDNESEQYMDEDGESDISYNMI